MIDGATGADETAPIQSRKLQAEDTHPVSLDRSSAPETERLDPKLQIARDAINFLEKPSVTDGMDWFWARTKAETRIEELRASLPEVAEAHGLPADGFQILGNGSMFSGHFTGPKIAEHSLNIADYMDSDAIVTRSGKLVALDQIDQVVEADLRIVIPEGFEADDPRIIEFVEDLLGGEKAISKVETERIHRWGRFQATTHFYQYEEIADRPECENILYETEISINSPMSGGGYVEIADFWAQVFSQEEISAQTDLREALRALKAPLSEDFNPTKGLHCQECRWRIVASHALYELLQDGKLDMSGHMEVSELPLPVAAPDDLRELVDAFLNGELPKEPGSSLGRPERWMTESAETRIRELADGVMTLDPDTFGERSLSDVRDLILGHLKEPSIPRWVRVASSIQRTLQAERDQEH